MDWDVEEILGVQERQQQQQLQNQQNQITHEGFRGNESPIPLPSWICFFRVILRIRPWKTIIVHHHLGEDF